MQTTLTAIRKHQPCEPGWEKLLRSLGKTKANNEPLSILKVLESNGLDDAIWCLRAVEGYEKEIRLYTVWCARQVQHLMTDPRSLNALDVSEAFANGQATKEELDAAGDAAVDAAGEAVDAAGDAALAAVMAAVWAAQAAARAARAAACDAARDAAWAAAWAAGDAWAAAWAARDAARDAQEKELIRICKLSENGENAMGSVAVSPVPTFEGK
jgi:hypothetical protein